jgi:hypothetical protein
MNRRNTRVRFDSPLTCNKENSQRIALNSNAILWEFSLLLSNGLYSLQEAEARHASLVDSLLISMTAEFVEQGGGPVLLEAFWFSGSTFMNHLCFKHTTPIVG